MKEIKIQSTLYVFNALSELPNDVAFLMEKAIEARTKEKL